MKRAWWRFEQREDDLSAEIENHIAMDIMERTARGESLADATAAARRKFGNREQVRATSRDMWGGVWLEQLVLDFRYAARKLRQAPGFAAVAALSLTIGIGATVTMYAVIDAADIRGPPYPHSEQLVVVEQTAAVKQRAGGPPVVQAGPAPPATTAVWLGSTRTFTAMSRVAVGELGWPHDDETEQVDTAQTPSPVPHETYTVIGVMPERVDYPAGMNGWIADRNGSHAWGTVLGRLLAGKTSDAAKSELEAITKDLPAPPGSTSPPGVRTTALRKYIRSKWSGVDDVETIDSPDGRLVRLAIGLFVLLIAVINVGNLLLARSAARHQEMTVRRALGASRTRLAQQLIVEGACIAAIGGVAGTAIARWGIKISGSFGALRGNGIVPVLDVRVMAFALVLTVIVALGTGFIPVLALVRSNGAESPRATAGRGRGRVQGALLATQIGAALTLLTGAGILGKELLRLEKQGFGFDPKNVVWFPNLQRPAGMRSVAFRESVLFGLQRVAGVASVSEYEIFGNAGFYPLGDSSKAGKTIFDHQDVAIAPGFIKNLRIPLVAGRDFTDADYASASSVALVSSSTAEHFWPGQNPLGQQVIVPPPMRRKGDTVTVAPLTLTVVGVTGNPRLGRVLGPAPMTLMRPTSEKAGFGASYLVRTTGDPDAAMPVLRHALNALQGAPLDRNMYGTAQKMGIDRQLTEQRVTTRALVSFAAIALLLAALGIHGLVAYSVAQRTREIGIRMALGAEARSVLLLVTRRGLSLAAVGITLGVAGAYTLSHAIRSMLYGTSPTDPTVFAGSAILLATVVIVASYLPARRATRVDPMVALRVD